MNSIANVSPEDTKVSGEQGVEVDILKNIIRQHWQKKMEGSKEPANKRIMIDIEEHAVNMHKILDAFDYEVFCIPNIISNSKNMTRGDLKQYMSIMESLAIGYADILDKELANLLMIGLTNKTKNIKGATHYSESLSGEINRRIERYENRVYANGRRTEVISSKLKSREGHIFRFFMKKRIITLRKKVDRRSAKQKRLEAMKQRYHGLIESMQQSIESGKQPKPQQ